MDSPIFRFQQIDDRIATSAQPTPEQIAWIKAQGFDAVVNLSTPTARNFVPDEARIALEAGLAYVHAPVDCSHLEPAHYEVLRGVLQAFQGRKVLVHCAGNVKSSALVQLWRIKERGEDRRRLTEELRAQGWHEPKWFAYLERMTGEVALPIASRPAPAGSSIVAAVPPSRSARGRAAPVAAPSAATRLR